MKYTEFFSEIKKNPRPVYLISGAEAYLRDEAVKALRALVLRALPEFNETILEAPEAQTIINACETLPMMADRRLVLVREFPLLGKQKTAKEAEQVFVDWLPNAPMTTALVILQAEMDGRKKIAQTLKKTALWLDCTPLEESDLRGWIVRQCKKAGKSIENPAYLPFVAGQDMYALAGHIQKLCDYAGERETITRADVDRLIRPNLEYSVFQIVDALLRGEAADIQRKLNGIVDAGESRVGIIAVISSQMRLLFHATAGAAQDALSANLKVNGYALTMLKKLLFP